MHIGDTLKMLLSLLMTFILGPPLLGVAPQELALRAEMGCFWMRVVGGWKVWWFGILQGAPVGKTQYHLVWDSILENINVFIYSSGKCDLRPHGKPISNGSNTQKVCNISKSLPFENESMLHHPKTIDRNSGQGLFCHMGGRIGTILLGLVHVAWGLDI